MFGVLTIYVIVYLHTSSFQSSHASTYPMILWLILILFIENISIIHSCNAGFTVYVYPLPWQFLERQIQARKDRSYHICRKCIWEQFALEYIIYDYFTQFCGRVYNPNHADFFYLPIVREIDYRIGLYQKGGRDPSLIERILLNAIEKNDTSLWKQSFNLTDKYWHRNGGSDHIIVMAAPVTNLRHESNMRGFFHYVSLINLYIE